MTGTQLVAAVREIRPDLPIIFMTGVTGPIESRQLRAMGIREVLKKPLLAVDIATALARHLQRRDDSAALASRE